MSQKTLVRAGAILLLLGLLTGLLVAPAMTGLLPLEPRSLLAAHLNALMGAFLLWGLAFSLPMLRYGPAGKARLAWAFLAAVYGNWLITAVKSRLHVSGLGWTGEPVNDAVLVALAAVVVLPSLGGAAAWVLGLF